MLFRSIYSTDVSQSRYGGGGAGGNGTGGAGGSGFAVIKISATQNKIAVFSNTATWNVPTGVTSVEYMIVAGGGAGGAHNSGGGGAGGYLAGVGYGVTPAQTFTVIVGAGGAGAINAAGGNGTNSVFATLTAYGGGGGAGGAAY